LEEGRLPKGVIKWRPPGRRKREDLNSPGRIGIGGGRLERQTQLEEEDNIINKWAQEDVNRLYSVLSSNNIYSNEFEGRVFQY
jgi:hypothetical protein